MQQRLLIAAIAALQSTYETGAPLPEMMKSTKSELARVRAGSSDPDLIEDLNEAIRLAEDVEAGDLSANFEPFKRFAAVGVGDAHRIRLMFSILEFGGVRYPFLILMRMDPRTLEAQNRVFRHPDFLARVAERLGIATYPGAVAASRLQGVEVLASAGRVRPYAVFSDFLAGDFQRDSAADGGFLFNWFADDLLQSEWPMVCSMFPNLAQHMTINGLANLQSSRFLTFALTAIHDLGHNDISNPALIDADPFERQGIEETFADTVGLWVGTSPQMARFMSQVMSPEEASAMSQLWFAKRIVHYIGRGFATDPLHGALNEDNDARTGVNFYVYAVKCGVLTHEGGHFVFNERLFPEMVSRLLDDLREVFSQLKEGAESFELACRLFNRQFGTASPITGKWMIPSELREFFAAHQTRRRAA